MKDPSDDYSGRVPKNQNSEFKKIWISSFFRKVKNDVGLKFHDS